MKLPLIAVCGPTGAGKSHLAILLAREFGGEVISCDSMQVYRHFDIGSAKLSLSERAPVRHHLIDVVDGSESFTAGDYARRAREVLQDLKSRNALPIVAGGTGFYLRALLDGLSPGPPSDPGLRARLSLREQKRPAFLHRVLRRLDPLAAERIHPRDVPKVIRALEIRMRSSHSFSRAPARDRLEGYEALKLGLFPPREALYKILNERCKAMFEQGLLDEIGALLANGIPRDSKPFLSLGYKEGLAILDGRMSAADALEQMRRETRRYAKRQLTWFRHEPGIVPLQGFGGDSAVVAAARSAVARLLNSK